VQAFLDRWPAGGAMTFYTDYKDGVSGKREFVGRATEQSQSLGAVAMKGGKIVMGQTHAIQSQATIVEKVNQLVSYLAGVLSPEDLAANRHKLAQLHIYGHGYNSGISTGGHRGGKKANMSTKSVGEFVAGIGGSLRGDVNVALMACSTGKDVKGKEGGEGSFADALRDELVEQGHEGANVAGHTTAGHTTGNPLGRYFTGKDEGGGGGDSFFDVIFPKAFREGEAMKLDLSGDKFRARLHTWFVQYTKIWRSGSLGKGRRKLAKGSKKFDMGYLMMVDPEQAKAIYRAAWSKAAGNFKDLSYVPSVDWSTVGSKGGASAVLARDEPSGESDEGRQMIDL